MKKIKILTYCLVINFMLIVFNSVGQNEIPPPVLKNVTVTNEAGDVKLTLDYPDTTDMEIIIFRDYYQAGDYVLGEIARVKNVNTWIDKNSEANHRTHVYKLSYFPPEQYRSSNLFNTIYSSLTMDTCKKINKLSWTRYVEPRALAEENWNDSISIKYYNIYRSIDSGDYKPLIRKILPEDTAFIDSTIKTNYFYTFADSTMEYDHSYTYYIEGIRASDTSIKSKSNRVSINTDMPDDPQYINFDKLETKEQKLDLKFIIDSGSELNRYVLLGSDNLSGPYDTVETFNTPDNVITYTDESMNPQNEVYYYHMASVNSCGALTTRSDTLSNILLNVEKQNLNNILEWNGEENLTGSSISYNIYRKIGEEGEREILSANQQPSYTDTQVHSFRGQGKSAQFCYYIEAEINHESGLQSLVISNNECVYIKPQVFIPNAIIPNDPDNNAFKPEFTFVPQKYLLIVYNRNGAKIFESMDYEEPWKGKIRGGRKAPGGTYIYYLEVKNPGQQIIRKKGEVTVIYQK